jgi:hypothetical protein
MVIRNRHDHQYWDCVLGHLAAGKRHNVRCIICNRTLKRQAIPSMVIGPVCLRKTFPAPVKRNPPSKAYRRDKKTLDLFGLAV